MPHHSSRRWLGQALSCDCSPHIHLLFLRRLAAVLWDSVLQPCVGSSTWAHNRHAQNLNFECVYSVFGNFFFSQQNGLFFCVVHPVVMGVHDAPLWWIAEVSGHCNICRQEFRRLDSWKWNGLSKEYMHLLIPGGYTLPTVKCLYLFSPVSWDTVF